MKINSAVKAILIIGLLGLLLSGCSESKKPLSPDQKEILSNCEKLFIRIKVGDMAVIYENEFPYLLEKMDADQYLNDRIMKSYSADTLMAVELDSVTVFDEDTAYVHMKLEYLLADSSLSVNNINLRWWHINDEWIKPTRSSYEEEQNFEEEMRIYWEAVEAMQKRQEQQEGQGDSL